MQLLDINSSLSEREVDYIITRSGIKIWDIMQFKIKENYIHQNPVHGGFVARAQDFLYSSASKHSPLIVDIY
jgi:hypothetical protein